MQQVVTQWIHKNPQVCLHTRAQHFWVFVASLHLLSSISNEKTKKYKNLPKLMTFWWFHSPKWSSMVSQRDIGPICLVCAATGLMLAHPHLGASPFVQPTPWVRLNEKAVWQAVMCAGRWNFGTKNIMTFPSGVIWICWGYAAIRSQRCTDHWQAISYDIMSLLKVVLARLEKKR